MKNKICIGLLILSITISVSCTHKPGKHTDAPAPYGALPSARQLAWHEMEMYNMIEFSTIQYLEEKDWGWGNEDPALVNPFKFNAEEIVLRTKAAGFKGLCWSKRSIMAGFACGQQRRQNTISINPPGGGEKEIGSENGRAHVKSMG